MSAPLTRAALQQIACLAYETTYRATGVLDAVLLAVADDIGRYGCDCDQSGVNDCDICSITADLRSLARTDTP